MRERIVGIYAIKNMQNGKMYIGQSLDIHRRWNSHKGSLRRQTHPNYMLQHDYNVYGIDAFSFVVLKRCENKDLKILESEFIDSFRTYDANFGYNLTLGGDACILTQECKERVKDIQIDKCGKSFFQISLDGKVVREWRSIGECSRELGYTTTSISKCLSKKCKTAYGCIWVLVKDFSSFSLDEYIDEKELSRQGIEKDANNEFKRVRPTYNNKGSIKRYRISEDGSVKEYLNEKEALKDNPNCQGRDIRGDKDFLTHGYLWRSEYKYDANEDYSYFFNKKATPVKSIIQYTLSMEVINEYPSLREASRCTSISRGAIKNAIEKGKSTGGYLWRYNEIEMIKDVQLSKCIVE